MVAPESSSRATWPDQLRLENRRQKAELERLQKQIADLLDYFFEQPRTISSLPLNEQSRMMARKVLRELPNPFTLEELISRAEEMDVDVFLVYDDIKKLQRLQLLDLLGERFKKSQLLVETLSNRE